MRLRRGIIAVAAVLAGLFGGVAAFRDYLPSRITDLVLPPRDIAEIRARQGPALTASMAEAGLAFGAPVHIRVFKEEAVLELWVQAGERFRLFRSYPICTYSGDLGPKLREGDGQSPEGFYEVGRDALNPRSSYHLSFNLGFPNAYDRAQGRTGSFLMIHGACVSIGCYAMTDPAIEEIYVALEAALRNGQDGVSVHVFPFRMTQARMDAARDSEWYGFWRELRPVHDAFAETGRPARIGVRDARYVVLTADGMRDG